MRVILGLMIIWSYLTVNIIFADELVIEAIDNFTDQEYIVPEIVAYYENTAITKDEIESYMQLTHDFTIDSIFNEHLMMQVVRDYATYKQLEFLAKSVGLDKEPLYLDKIKLMQTFLLVDSYFNYMINNDLDLLEKAENHYINEMESPNLQEFNILQLPFQNQEEAKRIIQNILERKLSFEEALTFYLDDNSLVMNDIVQYGKTIVPGLNPEYEIISSMRDRQILPYPIEIAGNYYALFINTAHKKVYTKFNELSDIDRATYIEDYYYNVFLPEFKAGIDIKLK